ncbi:MAG: uroporphyrinogen decarboxylase family protein [Armatimonadota bacterium]
MTSRQRLLAAMQREPTDRLPIHIRGVRILDDGWVRSRDASYEPLIEAVQQHGDVFATWNPGLRPFLNGAAEAGLRSTTRPSPHPDFETVETVLETPRGPLTREHQNNLRGHPGLTTRFYIETEEDVARFRSVPYVPLELDTASYWERAEQIGERGLLLAALGSNPIAQVHSLLGSERLATWSVTKRDVVDELVGLMAERFTHVVRELLAAGIGPAFSTAGHEYCIPPLQSPRDFHQWCVLAEKRVVEMIHEHGGALHVHCHGGMRPVLAMFAELGADCLHPMEGPPMGDITLAEAKVLIDGRICLEGNMQIGDLYTLSADEVAEKTRSIIDEGAPGGGYIFGVCASPYTPTLEQRVVANYVTMIETAAEHGAPVASS